MRALAWRHVAWAVVAVSGPSFAQDRPQLGAVGQYDYSHYLAKYSIAEPAQDVVGLWSVLFVTNILCGYVQSGDKSLIALVPEGFTVVRGDVHELGFEGVSWSNRWFRVSVTGDRETDATGGHPYWEVRYGNDGAVLSCGVTIGGYKSGSTASEADAEAAVQYLHIDPPQLFRAIMIEPRFAGLYPVHHSGLMELVTPCGGQWCELKILYDLSSSRWWVDLQIDFENRIDLDHGLPPLPE